MAKSNDIGDKKHKNRIKKQIFFLMFLLYKIRLALNVAPEGLPWHLRRPGPRVALHNIMLNQIQHLFIKGMPGQARHDWNGHCYTFS